MFAWWDAAVVQHGNLGAGLGEMPDEQLLTFEAIDPSARGFLVLQTHSPVVRCASRTRASQLARCS